MDKQTLTIILIDCVYQEEGKWKRRRKNVAIFRACWSPHLSTGVEQLATSVKGRVPKKDMVFFIEYLTLPAVPSQMHS